MFASRPLIKNADFLRVHGRRVLEGDPRHLLQACLAGLLAILFVRAWLRTQVLLRDGFILSDPSFVLTMTTLAFLPVVISLTLKRKPSGLKLWAAIFYTDLITINYSGFDAPYYVFPLTYLFLIQVLKRKAVTWNLVITGVFSLAAYSFRLGDAEDTVFNRLINVLSGGMLSVIQVGLFAGLYHLLVQHMLARQSLAAALAKLEEGRADELRQLAIEERYQLSRELHDTLGHHLTVTRINTQIARKLVARQPVNDDKLIEALDSCVTHSQLALQHLQAVVSALGTAELSNSLFGALRESAETWPTTVHLQLTGDETRLTTAHRLTLFRLFQETLTNSYKYAFGAELSISLTVGESDITFEAANAKVLQAAGAPSPISVGGGSGLLNSKRRLVESGGRLDITDSPDQFVVSGILPLRPFRPEE